MDMAYHNSARIQRLTDGRRLPTLTTTPTTQTKDGPEWLHWEEKFIAMRAALDAAKEAGDG